MESYLVTPYALGQRFSLSPVIFFAWLWGVVGALLAMPLLVSLKVICERVPALQHLTRSFPHKISRWLNHRVGGASNGGQFDKPI